MFRVFFRKKGLVCRYAPVDSEVRVVPCDGTLALRRIVVVAFVLEHSVFREDCKTVGESAGNKELTVVVFSEFHCHMLSVGRRAFPDVYRHIEDSAFDYTHKFGLSVRWFLKMETTHDSVAGLALIVLDEMCLRDLFGKDQRK